ncbi:hypothetical protein BJ742DRAFT_332786 [Cladochytrium replicatum]|nr:hypothetical protein BJ742DRAFT_332786 [Cladochytrium replicatum]
MAETNPFLQRSSSNQNRYDDAVPGDTDLNPFADQLFPLSSVAPSSLYASAAPTQQHPRKTPPIVMVSPEVEEEAAIIARSVLLEHQRAREQELLDAALARRLQIEEAGGQLPNSFTNRDRKPQLDQQLSDEELARRLQEEEELGNRYIEADEVARASAASEMNSDELIARTLAELDDHPQPRRPSATSSAPRGSRSVSPAPVSPRIQPPETSRDEAFARSLFEQDRARVAAQPAQVFAAETRRQRQELVDELPTYEEVPTEGTTLPVPAALRPPPTFSPRTSKDWSSPEALSELEIDVPENHFTSLSRLGPPVPAGISRLLFISVSKESTIVCLPAGAVLYSVRFILIPSWSATISRGSEFILSAEKKPSKMNFSLVVNSTVIAVEPTKANIKLKYAFKFRKVEYKWRLASFPDPIKTSNGTYRPHHKAIGKTGTIYLQQMPMKNICAIYMCSTGVLDMTEDIFDDGELRDVVIGSLFPVIEFGKA